MNSNLKEALDFALECIESDDNEELLLSARKKIWVAMGDEDKNIKTPPFSVGRWRRATLARLSVEYVLPLWQKKYPDDNSFKAILALVQDYLNGDIGYQQAREKYNNFYSQLEDMASHGYGNELAVGFAAAAALNTAMHDEAFDTDAKETDKDRGPYEWDAAYYASIAYADGASWEKTSVPLKRREFWLWYLNEAVIQSYDSTICTPVTR